MSFLASPRFLPRVLALDAAASAGTGLIQIFGGEALATLLQLPQALLLETGLFLLAWAAALAWVASRPVPPRKGIGVIAAANTAWAVAAIALMAGPWLATNTLGMVWLGVHAAFPLLMGDLQWLGLLRSRRQGGLAMAA